MARSHLPKITYAEFEQQYAEASGLTIEQLKEWGREARPCHCDYSGCQGWQMAHVLREEWFDQQQQIRRGEE